MKNKSGTIKENQNTTKLINQLKSSKCQYPTLDKKEERALIKKWRKDRDVLNQKLFMHNIRMVFEQAKRYKSKTADFDNMVQNGMVGLMEAARHFDIDKGIKFTTYAYMWVQKYILSEFYLKNKEVDQMSISLNESAVFNNKSSNDSTAEVEDGINKYLDPSVMNIKTVHDELSSNEQAELVGKLLDSMNSDTSLSATDKNVFMDIFYNRERPSDIADKYDMTMHDVNEIKKKILAKFRNELKANYSIQSFADVP